MRSDLSDSIGDAFTVYVRTQEEVISVRVLASAEVNETVRRALHIRPQKKGVQILLGGKCIAGSHTFGDNGLEDGATISVVVPPSHGMELDDVEHNAAWLLRCRRARHWGAVAGGWFSFPEPTTERRLLHLTPEPNLGTVEFRQGNNTMQVTPAQAEYATEEEFMEAWGYGNYYDRWANAKREEVPWDVVPWKKVLQQQLGMGPCLPTERVYDVTKAREELIWALQNNLAYNCSYKMSGQEAAVFVDQFLAPVLEADDEDAVEMYTGQADGLATFSVPLVFVLPDSVGCLWIGDED